MPRRSSADVRGEPAGLGLSPTGRLLEFARLVRLVGRYVLRRPHEPEFYALRRWKSRTGLFLDIGANIGQSALSFRIVNREAPILSIEPNPALARHLRLVKRLIPRFDYLSCAAGAEDGEATLYVPVWHGGLRTGFASLTRSFAERGSGAAESGVAEYKVPVRKLDDLELEPDFVKVDVEGGETEALRGLVRTLERSRPIVLVEWNNRFADVEALLVPLGYRPFSYDAPSGRLVPLEADPHGNVFWLPDSEAAPT
jgi:FkbM family methyltransferase